MKKNSVLIIDDHETTITALQKILSVDYTVFAALNGSEGIKLAEKYIPDIILLDILMLEMDGYQVIAELKKSEITRGIPVIFLTALTSDADEEKGLILGAVDYIVKPFSASIVKLRIYNQMKMLEQFRTIEKLSMSDQLTGLPNRRSFEERMKIEWSRAIREKTPIGILMIDIDKFKDYNDTYGHLQGDVILQSIANAFPAVLRRPADFIARWGGEEFIVVLPNTSPAGALEIAEKIRKAAEDVNHTDQENRSVRITVSVGVNSQEPPSGMLEDFFQGADTALYEAKKQGRNRVCLFSDIPGHSSAGQDK